MTSLFEYKKVNFERMYIGVIPLVPSNDKTSVMVLIMEDK